MSLSLVNASLRVAFSNRLSLDGPVDSFYPSCRLNGTSVLLGGNSDPDEEEEEEDGGGCDDDDDGDDEDGEEEEDDDDEMDPLAMEGGRGENKVIY